MPLVRIHNATGEDLDQVRLYVPTPEREVVEFGSLAHGANSEYREVPLAYRFAEVEAAGSSQSYTVRPYDYVGEEPLAEGRYTYRLGVAQDRLTLDLEPTEGVDEQHQ